MAAEVTEEIKDKFFCFFPGFGKEEWHPVVLHDGYSDYTGWLGSWQNGSDTVDYIKFTVSKSDVDKELSVSLDNYTLFDSKGNKIDTISAAGTYTLQLTLDKEADSTSYTLALA